MKKQRVKPGDILEIQLPNGRFAYGKLFKDASIGIYNSISSQRRTPANDERFMFVVGVYRDLVTSGKWPKVGHEPFPTEDAAWPPPSSVKDALSGDWSIYHRGEMRPASASEAAHMEVAAVWDEDDIVKRILDETPN